MVEHKTNPACYRGVSIEYWNVAEYVLMKNPALNKYNFVLHSCYIYNVLRRKIPYGILYKITNYKFYFAACRHVFGTGKLWCQHILREYK